MMDIYELNTCSKDINTGFQGQVNPMKNEFKLFQDRFKTISENQ